MDANESAESASDEQPRGRGGASLNHHETPRKSRRRISWEEIQEAADLKRQARQALRVARRGADTSAEDDEAAWARLEPHHRHATPTAVEREFDMEPGIRWVGVLDEILGLVPVHRLTALDLETLLTFILIWQYHAECDEFVVTAGRLEQRLYQDPRRIEDSILHLSGAELIAHSTGGLKNRTNIGMQPLRKIVSGADQRLLLPAKGRDLRRVWGFSEMAPMHFFAVPERLIEQLSAPCFPDRARLAFYWLLHLRRRSRQDAFPVDTHEAAKWMWCSARSVRRALTELVDKAAIDLVTHRDGIWAVDVAPTLELIKPAALCLRPSVRKASGECPKDGAP